MNLIPSIVYHLQAGQFIGQRPDLPGMGGTSVLMIVSRPCFRFSWRFPRHTASTFHNMPCPTPSVFHNNTPVGKSGSPT